MNQKSGLQKKKSHNCFGFLDKILPMLLFSSLLQNDWQKELKYRGVAYLNQNSLFFGDYFQYRCESARVNFSVFSLKKITLFLLAHFKKKE